MLNLGMTLKLMRTSARASAPIACAGWQAADEAPPRTMPQKRRIEENLIGAASRQMSFDWIWLSTSEAEVAVAAIVDQSCQGAGARLHLSGDLFALRSGWDSARICRIALCSGVAI